MNHRAGCIFCKIADGKAPSEIVYQDDTIVAFRDINPGAPVHVIIIPRIHISSLTEVTTKHRELMGHLIEVANEIAKAEGIAERGYRLIANCGQDGRQVVPHIHFHLLGGQQLPNKLD
ncbi:MAG: histidine triad nucleotide-binding protein [Dehalococcoidia bacterium]|nr:histidine triad nucleotide-binding protein [Dehalococcoidia bacterium]